MKFIVLLLRKTTAISSAFNSNADNLHFTMANNSFTFEHTSHVTAETEIACAQLSRSRALRRKLMGDTVKNCTLYDVI
jgi:hypothetical protein